MPTTAPSLRTANNLGQSMTTPPPPPSSTGPPADWYPDPSDNTLLRYWSGQAWTDHTAPAPPATSAPITSPSSFNMPGPRQPGQAGSRDDGTLPIYYQRKFTEFDTDPTSKASWNWAAFLFGPLWYLVKGMWVKALIYFAAVTLTGGILAIPAWIYGGVMGNYDYYLKHRQGKQI